LDRIIVSVPYTGTRFLKERLGVNEHIHTVVSWDALVERLEGKEIIAPLRNPYDVWGSTIRRWVKLDHDTHIPNFISAWYVMHALTLIKKITFIPVDLKIDPTGEIKDWTKVTGEKDRHNKKYYPISLRGIYLLPFVKKYYDHKTEVMKWKEGPYFIKHDGTY